MERIAGGIVLLCGWRRALAAFLSGAFAVLAQAPFDFLAACFISFPVLVWLIDGATPGEDSGRLRRLLPAFATGWWFGLGYFVAGLWWVGNALLVDADGFAWAIPIAVLMLPAYLALFHGLAAALARLFWGHDLGRIAALAAGFGIAEWLRGLLFTGFPWNAIGYAAMPVPLLMQPVAAIGLDSMNALAVFVFAMPALAVSRTEARKGALLAAAIAATGLGFGYWRLALPEPGGEALAVRVVQASIDQAGKWDRELRDEIFRRHLELSAAAEAGGGEGVPELILWPETAVPFLFSDRPDALLAIGDLLEEGQTLLAGAVRTEGDERTQGGRRYYNSIVAIDHQGEIVAAADKVHLVPFGEYLPFATVLESLGLRRLASGPGVFSAAPERALITIEPGLRLLPLICYEIIFPAEVAGAASDADMIVNLTNDAWYGDTPGPYQHFRQAQVRAVETGLPLIRAANNGISAVVDSRGRLIDALALNQIGSIDARVEVAKFPVLPYHDRIFAGILLILSVFAGIMHLRGRFHSN